MNSPTSNNNDTIKEVRKRAEMFHCFLVHNYAHTDRTLAQIKKDIYEQTHLSIGAFLYGEPIQVCLLHSDLFSVTPNPTLPSQASIRPNEYPQLQFTDEISPTDTNNLCLRLKNSTVGEFDFVGFASEINHSLGAVYYGAAKVASEWSQDSLNPEEILAVKEFDETDEGGKWANWLANDLIANGPLNLGAIGNLHILPETVKATRWIKYISKKMDIEYDFAGGGNDICWAKSKGRRGKVRNNAVLPTAQPYVNIGKPPLGQTLNPIKPILPKPMTEVGNVPVIPIKDSLQLQRNQRFWGVADKSEHTDPFGNPMMLIKMLQLEHTSELAGFHLRTKRADYVADGEFVVGGVTYSGPSICPLQGRPIMLREWTQFAEARSHKTFDEFLNTGRIQLQPLFRTFAREIFILDSGRVYAGIDIDFNLRTTKLREKVLRSRETLGDIHDLATDFFFLNSFKKITYLQDEFWLAFAHKKYSDTDALLSSKDFWEELSPRHPANNDNFDDIQQILLDTIIANGGCINGPKLGSALRQRFPQFAYPYKGCARLRDLALTIPYVDYDYNSDEYHIVHYGSESGSITSPSSAPIQSQSPLPAENPPAENPLDGANDNDEKALRNSAENDQTETNWEHNDEFIFLDNLLQTTKYKCHYNYFSRDIIRFHAAVKNGMLTILGGDPGIGKSSLIEIYSRALFGNTFKTTPADSATFLQISVNPAWAEPADLLGFEGNPKFREAPNGLCFFLRQAMNVRDLAPRICCFEEINLACVEHYFSDFIQLLSRPHNRVIEGYNRAGFPEQVATPDQSNQHIYPPLELVDNVRFVGTCNFDDTVKPMSRRFYDRCHYIELKSADTMQFTANDPTIEDACFENAFKTPIDWKTFSSWGNVHCNILAPVSRLFTLLSKRLAEINLLPSFRCVSDIKRYVITRPPNPDDTDDSKLGRLQLHALDEAIAQKILSKFRPDPFKNKEQEALYEFLINAKFTISAGLMETLNKRYAVPTF